MDVQQTQEHKNAYPTSVPGNGENFYGTQKYGRHARFYADGATKLVDHSPGKPNVFGTPGAHDNPSAIDNPQSYLTPQSQEGLMASDPVVLEDMLAVLEKGVPISYDLYKISREFSKKRIPEGVDDYIGRPVEPMTHPLRYYRLKKAYMKLRRDHEREERELYKAPAN